MTKVNFILPFIPTKPIGGAKIMFEYANQLANRSYSVTILYSIKRPFKKSRTPVWIRYILLYYRKVKWFTLHPSINQRLVPEINDRFVPDASATISTWWQMAYALANLSGTKGKKINLIQDYEIWNGNIEKVHQSYSLPVQHVVIAKYLSKLMSEVASITPVHIQNAIDLSRFSISRPIENRPDASVIMLYSEEERKGSVYGLEAIFMVRELIKDIRVTFFSVYNRPPHIPDWIQFITRPKNLPELYNQHAIFITPSIGEGWALPPAEAMSCGCAVICTDIGGHLDYAIHSDTALLVPPKNPELLAKCIIQLIENKTERVRIANAGKNYIEQFRWERSTEKLINEINRTLK